MSIQSDNNKRIAKNTLLLYCRMFVTMLIGFYTSRVVLNSLGVVDYGIYNVVGGIVSVMITLTVVYYLGLDYEERQFVSKIIREKILSKIKK